MGSTSRSTVKQQAFDRIGIPRTRQTFCDWVGWCSDQLERNRPAGLSITHKFQPSKIHKILKNNIESIRFVMNLKSAS